MHTNAHLDLQGHAGDASAAQLAVLTSTLDNWVVVLDLETLATSTIQLPVSSALPRVACLPAKPRNLALVAAPCLKSRLCSTYSHPPTPHPTLSHFPPIFRFCLPPVRGEPGAPLVAFFCVILPSHTNTHTHTHTHTHTTHAHTHTVCEGLGVLPNCAH
jgi:hypothetical protein